MGIRDLLLYTKHKYDNPLIYITENGERYFILFEESFSSLTNSSPNEHLTTAGVDEPNNEKLSLKEALKDEMRIKYHHDHLAFLQLAIKYVPLLSCVIKYILLFQSCTLAVKILLCLQKLIQILSQKNVNLCQKILTFLSWDVISCSFVSFCHGVLK